MSTGKPKDLSGNDSTCLTDIQAKFGTLYHFSAKPEETASLEKIAPVFKGTNKEPIREHQEIASTSNESKDVPKHFAESQSTAPALRRPATVRRIRAYD